MTARTGKTPAKTGATFDVSALLASVTDETVSNAGTTDAKIFLPSIMRSATQEIIRQATAKGSPVPDLKETQAAVSAYIVAQVSTQAAALSVVLADVARTLKAGDVNVARSGKHGETVRARISARVTGETSVFASANVSIALDGALASAMRGLLPMPTPKTPSA